MLRTYRTCNSTVGFSEYDFCKKLLAGVTLSKVTPSVTLTQLIYIYIYIYIYIEREKITTYTSMIWLKFKFYSIRYK